MLEPFDLAIDPGALAARLTAAERALIAIIIALDGARSDVKLLILDEVTAALPRNQAEPYLERVAALARSVSGFSWSPTALPSCTVAPRRRRCCAVGPWLTKPTPSTSTRTGLSRKWSARRRRRRSPRSASLGAGGLRALWSERRPDPSGETALSVHGLEGAMLRDLSFDVRRGEIVGAAGLGDSGVAELPRILAGLEAPTGGSISVGGKPVPPRATPRTLIRAGMVVPPGRPAAFGGVATLWVGGQKIPLARSSRVSGRSPVTRSNSSSGSSRGST